VIRPRRRKASVRLLQQPPASGRVQRSRLVPRSPNEGPLRIGYTTSWRGDLYHQMLVLRWPWFLALAVTLYLGLNVMFAGLYFFDPGGIDKAKPGSFSDAFFFSIQTMATIGYGVLTPADTYTNLVVTLETLFALGVVAMATGLTFARFSRPTARVTFSGVATVSAHNGVPTLAIRLSNGRRNQILEADVALTLLRNERTAEGQFMRRFYDLALLRNHTPIFSLTFTVMHPVDETSPLYGATPESLAAEDAELLTTVTGLDETMSQTIHARTSYIASEIRFGQRFADMFGYTEGGRIAIDYSKFNETIPQR